MQLDLTDDERDALVKYLRAGIDADKFPLSQRLRSDKGRAGKARPAEAEGGPAGDTERAEAGKDEGAVLTPALLRLSLQFQAVGARHARPVGAASLRRCLGAA